MSPLTWGRGLKLKELSYIKLLRGVAPHVGAWIETGIFSLMNPNTTRSPLTWGRGLKHLFCWLPSEIGQSPLTWGRGLKHGVWR